MIGIKPFRLLGILTCYAPFVITSVAAALPSLDHVFNITVYLDPPSPPITALAGQVLRES